MNINDSYLNESLLNNFIKTRSHIKFNKSRIKEINLIPDLTSEDGKVIIEFDGYYHYTSMKNIIRDNLLKDYCKRKLIKLIQIPYFIQLNSHEIIEYYFNGIVSDFTPFNSYKHGFIHDNISLPSDFCYNGLLKFISEFNQLPYSIRDELIKNSLMVLVGNKLPYIRFLPSDVRISENNYLKLCIN